MPSRERRKSADDPRVEDAAETASSRPVANPVGDPQHWAKRSASSQHLRSEFKRLRDEKSSVPAAKVVAEHLSDPT